MMKESTNDLREAQLRQHIGPAVKELREREGWSLRDLGARCGVSSAYLSRIERGSSIPSFSILARISSAFRVSPEYFIEFERSAREVESALADTLEQLSVPRSTWHEFAELSMEAQGALVDAFRQLKMPISEKELSHTSAEALMLSRGVKASIPALIEISKSDGLQPADFARHRTQLEESHCDRFVMIDRLCTLPATWLFDQLDVFRGTFGVEPEDPMLLKWWVRAQRSALLKVLDGSTSRSIYPKASISNYVRTGNWGKHVRFEPDVVRQHVAEIVKMLRERPSYQVGLHDGTIPARMIGKVTSGVLFITPEDPEIRKDGSGEGLALRFSSEEATRHLLEYFDEFWNSIPDQFKSNQNVADWLEAELGAGFAA